MEIDFFVSEAKATSDYQTYGVLYNWPAAMNGAASSTASPSGVQVVCPTGWHLPSYAEWTELENYLIDNGYNYDGTTTENKIAKSLATSSGWAPSSNTGAIGNTDYPEKRNLTGFSALPGGTRGNNGSYGIGGLGYWWNVTEDGTYYAWYWAIHNSYSGFYRYGGNKHGGFSVRCLHD